MASVLSALEFSSRPDLADRRALHAGDGARFRTAGLLGDRYARSGWSLIDPEGDVQDVASRQKEAG